MKKIRIKQAQTPVELFSTMGCRTQNGADINALNSYQMNIQSVIETGYLYDNYISAAQKDGRGNICPVTIILPTIAMEAKEIIDKIEQGKFHCEYTVPTNKGDVIISNDDGSLVPDLTYVFMELLDEAIHDAKDMLIERFEYICSQSPASAKFMYENNTMAGYIPEEGIRSALKHGTLAVGQLGLAECLEILIGEDHTTEKGMALAKRIEQLFKDRCAEFKQEYKLNFGVYFTPKHMWVA